MPLTRNACHQTIIIMGNFTTTNTQSDTKFESVVIFECSKLTHMLASIGYCLCILCWECDFGMSTFECLWIWFDENKWHICKEKKNHTPSCAPRRFTHEIHAKKFPKIVTIQHNKSQKIVSHSVFFLLWLIRKIL